MDRMEQGFVTVAGAYADVTSCEDRLASTLVRRMSNRHQCEAAGAGKPPAPGGPACRHRNHRRDSEAAHLLFAMLGLTGTPAVAGDYATAPHLATFRKEEAESWR